MKPLRLLLNLLVLSLLIGIFLSWLLTTQSASQLIVNEINSRTPITITGFKGALTKTLQFEEIIIHSKSGEPLARISQVELSLDFHSLVDKEIHINSVVADTVEIYLPGSTAEQKVNQEIELPEIELPWNFYLQQLVLKELFIHKTGSNTHKITDINLVASFIKNQLNIDDLSANFQELGGNLKSDIKFVAPHPINLTAFVNDSGLKINSQIHITGAVDDYSLALDVENKNQDLPFSELTAEATGNLTELKDINAKLATSAGDISMTGQVKFKDELTANILLTGQHLNPAAFDKELHGDLSISTSLNYTNSSLEIKSGIDGNLHDYPLRIDFYAIWKDDWLNIQQATLKNGPNKIDIKGKANTAKKNAVLEWDIDSPSLDMLYPESRGTIIGAGRLNINTETLTGSGNLKANNIGFKQYSLESMDIQFNADLDKTTQAQQSATINARNIKIDDQLIETLAIQAVGTIEDHSIAVAATLPSVTDISFNLAGSSVEKTWDGSLQQLSINSKEFGHFKQEENTAIQISKEKTSINPVCLTYKSERVCAETIWAPGAGNKTIHVTLVEIPISRFSSWVPQAGVIKDKINATLDFGKTETGWSADVRLEIDNNNKLSINKLTLIDETLDSGSIDFQFDKMVWLTLFSDSILKPTGVIKGSLKPGGTLSDPKLEGEIILTKGSLLLPETGIEVFNINTRVIMLNLYEAIIMGKASSDKGWLDFHGKAGWKKEMNLALSFGGKEFKVINLPEIKATASPDLTLMITGKNTQLSGRILLPEAKINVLNLPQTVTSVSADEVIIDDQTPEAPDSSSKLTSTFITDINLILGDNVRISGEGAEFKVSGNVKLHKTKNLPIQTFGKINIDEGTYQAYGQDLTIRKGEIYLAGLPDNPGLAIEAVRELKGITAGLMLRGTLKQPVTTIFSEPAMPETEALSYLLTGRSLTETSTAENNILLNAVTKFGIKGSAGMVENLKASTGLSALEIQAGDSSADTSILLGKYLTPQLYIQYVKRLFDNQDSAYMRYEINKSLSLEAESGTSQGIDLIYEIETD